MPLSRPRETVAPRAATDEGTQETMAHDRFTAAIAAEWKDQSYYDDAERRDWLVPFWTRPRFRANSTSSTSPATSNSPAAMAATPTTSSTTLRDPRSSTPSWPMSWTRICVLRRALRRRPPRRTLQTDGDDLPGIPDASVTALFSYDAMVHFEYTAVLAYIAEAYRVLEPGGKALMHHSNYDRNPGGFYRDNPHWRNFMTKALFAHAACRRGSRCWSRR